MAVKTNIDKQLDRAMNALVSINDAQKLNASVKHKNLLLKIYNCEVDELDKIMNDNKKNDE